MSHQSAVVLKVWTGYHRVSSRFHGQSEFNKDFTWWVYLFFHNPPHALHSSMVHLMFDTKASFTLAECDCECVCKGECMIHTGWWQTVSLPLSSVWADTAQPIFVSRNYIPCDEAVSQSWNESESNTFTRMHSSSMRTVRCGDRLPGGVCLGVSAWGVSAQGHVCPGEGVSAQGWVSAEGVSAREVVSVWGCLPSA